MIRSADDLIKVDNANQDSVQACFDMKDEDDLFHPSLAERIKMINPPSRGNLRVQIEHLTN